METKGPLQRINLSDLGREAREVYQNFVVDTVNDSCLRMAVFSGEYPWHRHPGSDELFMVLEGELWIDFVEQGSVVLRPMDVFTIPAGVVHRTRALIRTVNLCFEHLKAETEFIDN